MFKLALAGILMLPMALLIQTGKANDERDIREVVDQFMAAWNRHDARAFAEVFSEDAEFVNWRGEGATGRAKVEEFHTPVFATVFSKSHQEYSDIKTRLIRPDVAAVDARWKMTGLLDRQGNFRPDREGLLSFVMAKNAGRWESVVMHNLDTSALPPLPK